eukprot:1997219-Karenia_brevis.AAC.1
MGQLEKAMTVKADKEEIHELRLMIQRLQTEKADKDELDVVRKEQEEASKKRLPVQPPLGLHLPSGS